MACQCRKTDSLNDGISFVDANFAYQDKPCGCGCGSGAANGAREQSTCGCGGVEKRCLCDGDSGRRVCCDRNGCCAMYPCRCRDPFWPEFAHPRNLCCDALYRCDGFEEEDDDCGCSCDN